MSLLDVAKDVFLEIACRISLEDVSCLRKTCKLLKEKIDEIGFRPCVAKVITRKYSQKVWSLCTANHSANEFVVVPSPPNPLLTKRFEEQLSDDYFSIVPKHPDQKGKNSKKKKKQTKLQGLDKIEKVFLYLRYDVLYKWQPLCIKLLWNRFVQKYNTSLESVTKAHFLMEWRGHVWFTNMYYMKMNFFSALPNRMLFCSIHSNDDSEAPSLRRLFKL